VPVLRFDRLLYEFISRSRTHPSFDHHDNFRSHVCREQCLIRPPVRHFAFTPIHGLTGDNVRDAPFFDGLWPTLLERIADTSFLAGHNAPFDRHALGSCCRTFHRQQPPQPFVCTVRLARTVWSAYPTKLADVCRHLNIQLRHHETGSDAEACALRGPDRAAPTGNGEGMVKVAVLKSEDGTAAWWCFLKSDETP